MIYWLWPRILFRRTFRTWNRYYRWRCCGYGCPQSILFLLLLTSTPSCLCTPCFPEWRSFRKINQLASLSSRTWSMRLIFIFFLFYPVEPLLLSCAGWFMSIWTLNNKENNNFLAETDQTFPVESRRRAEDILVEIKATYHIQVFSGVTHGFGTRGDPNVENSRMFIFLRNSWFLGSSFDCCLMLGWAKEKSAQGIIEWFVRFSTT